MTSITTWIYSKLETVCGFLSGSFTLVLTVPSHENEILTYTIRLVLAVVFGFLGAMGAALWKYLEKQYTKRKKK